MEDKNFKDSERRIIKWLSVIIAILILFNFWNYAIIKNTQQSVEDIKNQLYNVESRINEGMNNIEKSLEKKASILSDFNYSVEGFDIENKVVNIKVKATPKIYKEGLKLSFTYSGDDLVTTNVEGILGEGQSYNGNISVPLTSEIIVGVIIDDGSSKQQELCETIRNTKEQYQLQFNTEGFSGNYDFKDGKITLDGEVSCSIYPSSLAGNYTSKVNCNILIKDKVVETIPLESDASIPSRYTMKLKKEYELELSDSFDILIETDDVYGFNYKSYVMRCVVQQGDKSDVLDYSGGNGMVIITP